MTHSLASFKEIGRGYVYGWLEGRLLVVDGVFHKWQWQTLVCRLRARLGRGILPFHLVENLIRLNPKTFPHNIKISWYNYIRRQKFASSSSSKATQISLCKTTFCGGTILLDFEFEIAHPIFRISHWSCDVIRHVRKDIVLAGHWKWHWNIILGWGGAVASRHCLIVNNKAMY